MGDYAIIPAINGTITEADGCYVFPEKCKVAYGGFTPWCTEVFFERLGRIIGKNAAPDLNCYADECAENLYQETNRHPDSLCKDEDTNETILLCRKSELAEEAYELNITEDEITIEASTERGVVWALTTLISLLAKDRTLSCVSITDAPLYAHRGLSLDCARHFFPADEVKKIIEEVSLAKMNVLHWHLTDDQGWRIESKKYPKLTPEGSEYYTQEEIQEICTYARLRGVEIIPEIDMPGHVSALLAAYPQYSCSGKPVSIATAGGIYPVILCPGKEEVFAFLEDLLGEILPLFPGERMHLGGDEAPKNEWKKCPYCAVRMKQLGYTQWENLQGYFMTRASEILSGYGKTAICWNETLRSQTYPKDAQIQYWTLQYRDSMEQFSAAGGKWIYSDMFELYLDYPYSMTSVKKLYETVPHLGDNNALSSSSALNRNKRMQKLSEMNVCQTADRLNKNHGNGTTENSEKNPWESLLGMETCIWAEHITECGRLENLLFPRVYALAEIAWSGAGEYDEFAARLAEVIETELHADIAYTASNWWVPTGSERQKEAFGYMAAINSGMSDEVREQTVESTAPNEEFGRAFMTKFFQPEDIPLLMGGR